MLMVIVHKGTLAPACQRSILVLSTAMLLFAAKICHMFEQAELIKLLLPCDVDPYLGISNDLQVYVKPHTNAEVYYSSADTEEAVAMLAEMKQKIVEFNNIIPEMIRQSLTKVTKPFLTMRKM